jgi:hypothetical protein
MEPSSRQPSIGIRRESKNRWERRCALAPAHVQQLVKNGIRVVVQPSTLRTYPDRKYLDVRYLPTLFNTIAAFDHFYVFFLYFNWEPETR